jgi:ABC-type microcin C transport system duplicated ATPase subunit YejF
MIAFVLLGCPLLAANERNTALDVTVQVRIAVVSPHLTRSGNMAHAVKRIPMSSAWRRSNA